MLVTVGTAGSAEDPGLITYVDEVLIEESPIVEPYFDGASVAAGDFTTAWVGTAHASASVQYALDVPDVTAPSATVAVKYVTTDRPYFGTKAMRTRLLASGPTGVGLTVAAFTPTVGTTYTLLGRVRANSRDQTFTPRVGSATGTPFIATMGVWTEFRLTVTATNASSGQTGLLIPTNSMGHQYGDTVDIDQVLLVDGAYTGPYFDGSAPARFRENLVNNPNFGYGSTGNGWGSYWSPVRSLTTNNPYPGGNGTSMLVSKGTDQHTEQGASITTATRRAGATYRMMIRIRGEVGTKLKMGFHTGSGTAAYGSIEDGDGQWHEYTYTWVETSSNPGTANIGIKVNVPNSNTWLNNSPMFQIDSALFEIDTAGPYFDADFPVAPYSAVWEGTPGNSDSYLYDGDFTYAWTGVADDSTSTQSAPTVATRQGSAGLTTAIQSVHVPTDRTKSARVLAIADVPDDNALFYPTSEFSGLPVGTYTYSMDVWVSPGSPPVRLRVTPAGDPDYTYSNPTTTTGQWERLSVSFTTVATNTTYLRARNVGIATAGSNWLFDRESLVAGFYSGDYFDGSFPDAYADPDEEATAPIGAIAADYEWTGTPDASTSTYTSGSVVAVPDPVEYQRLVDGLTRYLHTVTCVSGPIVEQKLHRGDTWGYVVEFVLVAAVPWMFGVTKPVTLAPSLPIVVQDVPFNLVPSPSAELESGTVVTSTNYVTNPSAETGITGWVAVSDGTKILPAQVAVSQGSLASGDTVAAGAFSAKSVFTANTTSTAGWFGTSQQVILTGITSTTRYSANLWATASIQSGTAVLGNIEYILYWQNSSNTVIGTNIFGTSPAAGGAKSVNSLLPPAGTTRVTIQARINVTSWSSGAIIRLYADAAAVTKP
ncbi:MAG TPA: hypothetical protein VNN23_11900 [Ornithinibacter sp.]|nr:hypothetical protein [Ornithinibacter sp.]